MTESLPVLVTGAAGFAGSHLLDLLQHDPEPLVAWRRPRGAGPVAPSDRIRWMSVDLLDRQAVNDAIHEARPAIIYHCAGEPHLGESWRRSYPFLAVNVRGTHHLVDAVRDARLSTRILIPGSAAVYRPSECAISESGALEPSSPYALSKLAQEMLGLRAADEDGISVVVARAFNHLGPRQEPSFVGPSIARQIALGEAGRGEPVIKVGNLESRRDLTDVRDTVRAYRALARHGRSGAVYNVCSGRAYAIRELLDGLVARARVPVRVRVEGSRCRPSDTPLVLGDAQRLRNELGWQPEIPLDRTLDDLLEYWRERVRAEGS